MIEFQNIKLVKNRKNDTRAIGLHVCILINKAYSNVKLFVILCLEILISILYGIGISEFNITDK